jgi:hypothetical protein
MELRDRMIKAVIAVGIAAVFWRLSRTRHALRHHGQRRYMTFARYDFGLPPILSPFVVPIKILFMRSFHAGFWWCLTGFSFVALVCIRMRKIGNATR